MRITASQTTRRGRFALFGEEGFLFSLDSETFFARHIQEGDCFSTGELAELRAASDTRKACDKALRCLSVRLWAAGELYQRLCRDFDEHSAAAAVAKMQQLELLDDASFARQKAAWMARRNKSPREIRMELARCGGDEAVTEAVMEELFAQNEEELSPARQAILRLLERPYAARLAAGETDKVKAALARRGFTHEDIRAALAAWQEQREE